MKAPVNQPSMSKRAGMWLAGFACASAIWYGIGSALYSEAGQRFVSHMFVSQAAASEQAQVMLELARTRVREHSEAGVAPLVLAGDDSMPGCGFTLDELEGRHYVLANAVIPRDDGLVEILAIPTTSSYPLLRLRFRPDGSGVGVVDEFWPGAG